MDNDRPIVFMISPCSGEKFDFCITTEDERASIDRATYCYGGAILNAMNGISGMYRNKGFTVLFEVD